jgi:hypothetical protein
MSAHHLNGQSTGYSAFSGSPHSLLSEFNFCRDEENCRAYLSEIAEPEKLLAAD